MQHSYKTIESRGLGEFKDRGSKFIGYAIPVRSEEEVKTALDDISSEHPKGRHVCYAFSIEIEEPIERANDDGEPAGSAGKPILGQIYSAGIKYVLVAVVRYFGGTLLGVSGLINAYKTTAALAIENAGIVTKHVQARYKLFTDYARYHVLMNFLKRNEVEIIDQKLDASCELIIHVSLLEQEKFDIEITELEGISVNFIDYEY